MYEFLFRFGKYEYCATLCLAVAFMVFILANRLYGYKSISVVAEHWLADDLYIFNSI